MILEVLKKIAFTREELIEIEAKAHDQLNKITERRNLELETLNRSRGNLLKDLDYLIKDRISILRQQVMSPEALVAEEARITRELDEIEQGIKACTVATKEVLHYVISFSELVKNAALYFEYALDSEKHAIVTQVFSELTIENGKLKYQAKEGFDALLRRYDGQNALIGDPTENRTLITALRRRCPSR